MTVYEKYLKAKADGKADCWLAYRTEQMKKNSKKDPPAAKQDPPASQNADGEAEKIK